MFDVDEHFDVHTIQAHGHEYVRIDEVVAYCNSAADRLKAQRLPAVTAGDGMTEEFVKGAIFGTRMVAIRLGETVEVNELSEQLSDVVIMARKIIADFDLRKEERHGNDGDVGDAARPQ